MPDEARQILTEVKAKAAKVRRDLASITRALRWYRFLVAFLLVVLAAVGVLAVEANSVTRCDANWANATRARTDKLTNLSNPRSDALAKLLRDGLVPEPNQAIVRADVAAYRAADEAYTQGLKDNPIPPSPTNNCSLF